MRVKYAVFILKYTNKRVLERYLNISYIISYHTKTKKKEKILFLYYIIRSYDIKYYKTTVCAGNILLRSHDIFNILPLTTHSLPHLNLYDV